ncbi:hypothetical protein [Aliarcobacter cryaerophilus]|uniref:Uncharacterized protein n=1 Tax=Aliarcobacter cryaerophilus TaxID=28198 RepID=A0A2S9TRG1_9BACT|nr:hypothetical protein [Aliarcobacter cryaerophilus]PRN01431.1 hypothetical protein CJ668_00185 [Arcobacter cryaerophilus gv. pseudocryaerophilus]
MKNITTVKELSGKFFVETKNGEIFELKIGDTIRENDIVFGSETNQAGSKIDILLENNSILTLDGLERVLFDITVLSSNLDNSIQTAFTQDQLQSLLSEPSNIDFSAWGADFVAENIDITEEETAAGEEEEVTSEGSIGTFALRDGSLVDIESDLRKKSFAKTQTFNEIEKSEELENLSLRNVAENNNNFIPPYTVTPLPNLPETGAGDPTPPTPTTTPKEDTPTTTPEKETPSTPCATGGTFNISHKPIELGASSTSGKLTELLSSDIRTRSDDIGHAYLGKNDKGKFIYNNKDDYGSGKAFVIDLQEGKDDYGQYIDDEESDSITGMTKNDIKTILEGVNAEADFLLIKVDGYEWDEEQMQSYGTGVYYLDKVTFAPCEKWKLVGRYSDYENIGNEEDNNLTNENSGGKYLVYSPQEGNQKVVIELNDLPV